MKHLPTCVYTYAKQICKLQRPIPVLQNILLQHLSYQVMGVLWSSEIKTMLFFTIFSPKLCTGKLVRKWCVMCWGELNVLV